MKFAEGDKVVTDSIDIVTKSVVKYMIKSGFKGFVRSEKEGEDIMDECLIFSGIDGRSLDPILKKLREKEATVKLKAIVTAHNQSWNVGELIKELRREHIYMNGGDRDEK